MSINMQKQLDKDAYYCIFMHPNCKHRKNMKEHAKEKRQKLLAGLLLRRELGSQVRLLGELRARGVRTTQATVSRDLQEMGYVRVRVRPGLFRYEKIEPFSGGELWRRLKVLFKDFVCGISGTGNLLVIKTSPGNANGVASLIDGLRKSGVLGTIAGDDTVLVVVDAEKARKGLEEELRALL